MHVLILSRSRTDRIRAANSEAGPAPAPPVRIDPRLWPFSGPDAADPDPAQVVRIDDIDLAFPNHQVGGTRLVLTQSTYSLQKLLDRLGPNGRIIASADPERLTKAAPEAFQRRGAWRLFTHVQAQQPLNADEPRAEDAPAAATARISTASPLKDTLARAYALDSADERVAICERAAEEAAGSAGGPGTRKRTARDLHDMEGARGDSESGASPRAGLGSGPLRGWEILAGPG